MGQFGIQPLYATPVYTELFDPTSNLDLMQDEIDLAITTTEFNLPGEHKFSDQLGHGICRGEFDGDWLQEKACVSFITSLNGAIERYWKYIGFPSSASYFKDKDNLNYDRTSWINKFQKGSYAHIHSHSTTDISGVYYYKAEPDSGSIFFESPVSQASCTDAWVQLTNRFAIPPKPGLLVLFPGWLWHGVSTNFTDHERISISWNIKFKRT